MMTREQAISLDKEIRSYLQKKTHDVDWLMDSGRVVMKRAGYVQLSYSDRTSMESARVLKDLVVEFLATKGIVATGRLTNLLDTYRPEVKVTFRLS